MKNIIWGKLVSVTKKKKNKEKTKNIKLLLIEKDVKKKKHLKLYENSFKPFQQ